MTLMKNLTSNERFCKDIVSFKDLKLEEVISQISAQFIKLSYSDIDKGINNALEILGTYTNMDSSAVYIFSKDFTSIKNTYLWCKDFSQSSIFQLNDVPPALFEYYIDILKNRKYVVITHINDLPENITKNEKKLFENNNFHPLLFVPMISQNGLYGVLAFYSKRNQKFMWPQKLVSLLQFIADITMNLIERKNTEDLLRIQRDLSLKLSSASSLQEVMALLLDNVLKIDCFDSGGVYLRNNKTGTLDLAIHRGLPKDFIESTKYFKANSPQAKIVSKGEPIFTTYFKLGLPITSTRKKEELKAIAIIPLKHKKIVIGALNLASHTHNIIPEDTRNTIEAISGIFKGAIIRTQTELALRKSEEKLRQAEKMQAIGQLAGGIAHDFNNQLTGIVGYADLLLEELRDTKELSHYVANILKASKNATDLTEKLLAFARKGKYLSVPVDMNRTIEEVISLLLHSIDKKIVIKQQLNAKPPTTLGDPSQLQNSILNLALNARDAMPEGGKLTFGTSIVNLDNKYCRKVPYEIIPGKYVHISVTDSGIGMDEEIKKHMFEPFFTTKQNGKGTGMGLAAAYGTIKNHKGSIDTSSKIGFGTTFNVYLPLHTKQEKEVIYNIERIEKAIRGTAHILLVDDEDIVCDLGLKVLEKLGYKVTICSTGAEALMQYRNSWSNIDLVILDMVMPEMNGRETFQAMKSINPNVKALLSSGYSINGEAVKIIDEGIMGFIQKPYRMPQLSQKIAKVLKKQQTSKMRD